MIICVFNATFWEGKGAAIEDTGEYRATYHDLPDGQDLCALCP